MRIIPLFMKQTFASASQEPGPARGSGETELTQPQSLPSMGSPSGGRGCRDVGKSRPTGIRVPAGISKGPGERRDGAANSAWSIMECFLKEAVFKPGR